MGYHLGVDLGTTYTAAALARGSRAEAATLGTRSVSIPSVVYLGAGSGGEELLIGEAAGRRAAGEPARVAREFKRRVGDPTPLLLGGSPVGAELLMARLLAWVVKQVATTEGAPPASLAVTHPANWGEYKLDLLRQAIHHVGLSADHLVPEPVAAASFYASQRDLAPGSTVAVYDLGGGTFDAALVRVDEQGFRIVGRPDGIERMGGIDFDHAVFSHVVATLGLDVDQVDAEDPGMAAGLAQLRVDCVEAKEALSSDTDVSIAVMLPTHHTEVRLTRTELEAMIRPALDETLVALRRTIASAEIEPADLHAVLLVGGSSRIPLVGQLVTTSLGRPIAIDARPKDAISLGAALIAAQQADDARGGGVVGAVAVAGGSGGGSADVVTAEQEAPPTSGPPTPTSELPPPPRRPDLPPPPLYPPAVARTPSGGSPAGAGAGTASHRAWWVAAAAVIVAVAAVTALLLTRDGGNGDDEEANGGFGGPGQSTESTEPTESTATSDPPEETTTTVDIFGGIDSNASTEPPDPLPGSDWNADARAQFVTDCGPRLAAQIGIVSDVDPGTYCGCIYDGVQSAGVPFDDFNHEWSAEDIDPSSDAGSAILSASTTCALQTGGG